MENVNESFDMMRKLLKQSKELSEEVSTKQKKSKEELLEKTKEKIYTYFEGLLNTSPLKYVRVQIDKSEKNYYKSYEIFLSTNYCDYGLYSEQKSLFSNKYSEDNKSINVFALLIGETHSGYDYFALTKGCDDYYFNSNWVRGLDENIVLYLVKNFDEIKNKVEAKILESSQKIIEDRFNRMSQENSKIQSLESFVCGE